MLRVNSLLAVGLLLLATPAWSQTDLPWWVDSVHVSPPGVGGIGAITLEGTWIDTGAPDAISHSVIDGKLHLTVAAPDLNVNTGDALTPWTLTEEFGPLDPLVNEINGSIFSVDPANRGNRQWVSGPNILGWIYPQPRGEFRGLGSLGQAGLMSAAYDVSANGNVVTGQAAMADSAGAITTTAFAWSEATGMISLGLLPNGAPGSSTGRGVSADGNYIVGDSASRDDFGLHGQEAFRWSLGSGVEGLGHLHEGYATSEARATSRNGEVVVGVDDFYPPSFAPIPIGYFQRAFRYTDASGMQDLGTLPAYTTDSASEAVDVSADGNVIVGNAFRSPYSATDAIHFDQAQPFLWTEETGMQGLGNPGRAVIAIYPTPNQQTIANAVSADGKIVVGVDRLYWEDLTLPPWPAVPAPFDQAVMWTEESGWRDLRPFRMAPGPEFVGSEAVDVSAETGAIIGQAYLTSVDATSSSAWLEGDLDELGRTQVPFIWDETHGMRPLARVLAGDYGLDFEGWRLNQATAISDDGTTIVGVGVNPDGVEEAWRAVMYRTTRAGDTDFDGDVDQLDVAALAANMGKSSTQQDLYWMDGDFDNNGVIDEADHLLLLANYDGRAVGDFNADGIVNLADYTVWRDHLGLNTGIADASGDGYVTKHDYDVWQQNFGTVLDGNLAQLTSGAVPEPATSVLTLFGLALCVVARRRHRDSTATE
ncbi:PEP-CTERM sorting domain-containing protein [Aeoliella mucimassa]|uniref:Ice-binding protein C-terminal domain-containing protein n=1 Tax=Aeoliella mucimassa TaxID=2527972 RepID=A0A518ALI7_9BACT|nr:PEP-CTERM sorting domain-containing protein [Aeoliella mucimassa]QDU55597.1 hypothetical protein Pan181_17890 [Aeoliella mucimassa]